jgi:membrane protein DedA with SNARE-associated domain
LAEIFERLAQLVQQLIDVLGYFGIALMMLVENLLPPIPSEAVMPFAGFMVLEGRLTFFGVILAGTLGAGSGALIIYYIGRSLGHDRLQRWVCRYGRFILLEPEDIDRALTIFRKHGKVAIFFGRLMPGVRSLISLPAGINKMPVRDFLPLTLLGTLLWNLLLVSAGYLLGQNWQRVLAFIDTYESALWIVFAALVAFFVFRKIQRQGQPKTTSCEDSPAD